MDSSPSGRVLPILGGNMLAPALCLICGKPGSNVEEEFADPSALFADPQIHEDFFGSVYFCKSCCFEIAAIFGAYSKDEIADISNQRDELLVEVLVKRSRIEELERIVDTLTVERLTDRGFTVDGSVSDTEVNSAEQSSHDGLSESVEQRADESPESTESDSSAEPAGINDTTGDDELQRLLSIT
jgi:hypothetical protein